MSSSAGPLSRFLTLNRSRYLDALRAGRDQGWTVAIGNEAGGTNLDSASSSIAYSYLASTLLDRPTVALLQTPRTDLQLRAENLYAYEMARLHPHQTDLLCIDDIPSELLPRLLSSTFALVDHNRLVSRFANDRGFQGTPKVVAIFDHHEDEGFHLDAEPRLVTVPVGSCASLVTQYFMEHWKHAEISPPGDLASLLLCAIFIDTHGLKPGGKAVSIDHKAAEFLLPKATFASSSDLSSKSEDHGVVQRLISTLEERKQSVAHLSSRDLLRRDYKEYSFNLASQPSLHVTVGIATVPLSPKKWFYREPSPKFWESLDAWADERRLDALGVLCTYNSPKSGRHKRQNIWIVKREHKTLKEAIWDGMEACEELKLERRNMEKSLLSKGMGREPDGDVRTGNGSIARIWKQKNAKATRKVIAPLVKSIIESS